MSLAVGVLGALALVLVPSARADTVALDSGFGTAGIVDTASGETFDGLAVQSDGKVVVTGTNGHGSGEMVRRYNRDGSADTAFGTSGETTLSLGSVVPQLSSVLVLSSGEILLAGSAYFSDVGERQFVLARLTSAGALDATFGTGGFQRIDIGTLVGDVAAALLQSDGKVVLVSDNGEIARVDAAGTLDSGFGTSGAVDDTSMSLFGAALQNDGSILVAGQDGNSHEGIVQRFTSTGALDTSFGTWGTLTGSTDEACAVTTDSAGRIVVASEDGSGHLVVDRLEAVDGSADASFGTDGELMLSVGSGFSVTQNAHDCSVLTRSDDSILVGGTTPAPSTLVTSYLLVHIDSTGVADGSFGSGGQLLTSVVAKRAAVLTARSDGSLVQDGQLGIAGYLITTPSVPAVSASASSVLASPTSVVADGSTTSTVTVTLRDASSTPVAGKAVSLAAGGSATVQPTTATTDAQGVAQFTVVDATAESVTVTATDTTDTITVTQTASISFTAVPTPPSSSPPPAPAPQLHVQMARDPSNPDYKIDLTFWVSDEPTPPNGYSVVWGYGQVDVKNTYQQPVTITHVFSPGAATQSVLVTFDFRDGSYTASIPVTVPLLPTVYVDVSVGGSSTGVVSTTSGPRFTCSSYCHIAVPFGQKVVLQATPENAISGGFDGWSGACSGTGDCSFTAGSAETAVGAVFGLAPPMGNSAPAISDTSTGPPSGAFVGYGIGGGGLSYGTAAYAYEGTWSPAPTGYRYQWFVCNPPPGVPAGAGNCTDIVGATRRRFYPRLVDIGKWVGVRVAALSGSSVSPAVNTKILRVVSHWSTATEPPTATTGAASGSKLGTAATLGGSIIPGGQAWTYSFKWGLGALDHSTGDLGTFDNSLASPDDSQHSVTASIDGLTPGKTYEYELVARTSSLPATTVHGGVRTFVAAAGPGAPVLRDSHYVDGTTPRIDVTLFGGGSLVSVSVTWSGPELQLSQSVGSLYLGTDPGASTTVPLSLPPAVQAGLTYSYVISASNSAGTGTISGSFTRSLPEYTPITTYYPSALTPTSATFGGTVLPISDATSYVVNFLLADDPSLLQGALVFGLNPLITWITATHTTTTGTGTTDKLTPGHTYYMLIRELAYFGTGGSAEQFLGQVVYFTTPVEHVVGSGSAGSSGFSVKLGCASTTGCAGNFSVRPSSGATAARGLMGATSLRRPGPLLAHGTFRIASGGALVVRVPLTARGRRWLRTHAGVHSLVLNVHDVAAGHGAIARLPIVVRRGKM